MNYKKKVIFYFPWKEVSGGPFFLSKLANDLAEIGSYDVYYVEYKEGLTDDLLSKKVNKVEYNKENFIFPFNEEIILITPIYWAYKIPKLNKKSKILFINWHYCCIPELKSRSHWSKATMNYFLKNLQRTYATAFLDYTHCLAQNTKKIKFEENFIPITLNDKNCEVSADFVDVNNINIGILGRLSMDKIYSCLNLINNIKSYKTNKKINIHIIGDGVYKEVFEEECNKIILPKNIHIVKYGRIVGENLKNLLVNKIDILFAMGTSVLEGAVLKLPSVIVPSNTKKFNCNKYVYLQDSVKYCLGWYNTQMKYLNVAAYPVEKILDDVYKDNKKEILGSMAFEYYLRNHKDNISFFVKVLGRTNFTYEMLESVYEKHKLLGPDLYLKLYDKIVSRRYENGNKFVSVFGIEFKFNRKKQKPREGENDD